MAVNGGKRPGAGRKKGVPNKATVLRQTKKAEVIAAMVDSGKPLAVTVLQKAMEFAEGAVAAYRPTMAAEMAAGKAKNDDGSHEEFGRWFDRWFKCIETMAKYQTPQMKAIDAPTPPPDPGAVNRRKVVLRIFAEGKLVGTRTNEDAA